MEDSGIDSDPKPVQDERLAGGGVPIASFQTSDSSCSSTSAPSPQKTNLKQLHRKLERRIEQAKKVQRLQEYKKSPGLIPIQRLPIPSKSPAPPTSKEHHPLVDWDTDDSEEDINFFPVKMRDGRQELSDTFSIENLPLSGGEEDEDDLDLLPPQKSHPQLPRSSIAETPNMETFETVPLPQPATLPHEDEQLSNPDSVLAIEDRLKELSLEGMQVVPSASRVTTVDSVSMDVELRTMTKKLNSSASKSNASKV